MKNSLKEFINSESTLRMFGNINFDSVPNWYKIVKYKKEKSLYINAYYGDKKIEIFEETDKAINKFLEFIASI